MLTRREALQLMSATGFAAAALPGCTQGAGQGSSATDEATKKHLRILATSDTHGLFVPWDYALDAEDPSGSMAKLATAIKELRDEDTLLVDAGDVIQDNMADLFHAEEVHPMVVCMNAMGYDIGVTGNHEYNYGMDITRKFVATFAGTILTGNVIDEHGDPIAEGYTILDKNGVRVGLIGMVTPYIEHWDAAILEGCVVSNPVEETRKLIDQIKDDVDVLIGVMHMGLENDYGVPDSGVRDLVSVCPEFDLVVASHEHELVEGEELNGVLVVENKYRGQTMAVVDLTLEPDGDGWKVAERSSHPVELAGYAPDPDILELMAPFDERAKQYAHEAVGTLAGGPLAPESEIAAIPEAYVTDTALVDLINQVQLHYSGADISAAALATWDANLQPGVIRRCDVSRIYKHANTLYTLEMTGAQLKKYLEWSARFYQTYRDGDLTLSFDPNVPFYCYDMFQSVTYQVNVAKEPGERIENLAWTDGRPLADEDVFVIVVNNFRANAHLLAPGVIYGVGDLPKLLETDIKWSTIGGVREMISDYIQNVKNGTITPECDNSWRTVGADWDEELHRRAVELIADGTITLNMDNKHLVSTPVTVDDVRNAEAA